MKQVLRKSAEVLTLATAFFAAGCRASLPMPEPEQGQGEEINLSRSEILAQKIQGIMALPAGKAQAKEVLRALSDCQSYQEQREVVKQIGGLRLSDYTKTLIDIAPSQAQSIDEIIFISDISSDLGGLELPDKLSKDSTEKEVLEAVSQISSALYAAKRTYSRAATGDSLEDKRVRLRMHLTREQEFFHHDLNLVNRIQDPSKRNEALIKLVNTTRSKLEATKKYPSIILTDDHYSQDLEDLKYNAERKRWTIEEIDQLKASLERINIKRLADRILLLDRAGTADHDEHSYAEYVPYEPMLVIYDRGFKHPEDAGPLPLDLKSSEWFSLVFYHEFTHHRAGYDRELIFKIPDKLAKAFGWRTVIEDFPGQGENTSFGYMPPKEIEALKKDPSFKSVLARVRKLLKTDTPLDGISKGTTGDTLMITFKESEDRRPLTTIIRLNGAWHAEGDTIAVGGKNRLLVGAHTRWYTVSPQNIPGKYWTTNPSECAAEAGAWSLLRPDFARKNWPEGDSALSLFIK